MYGKILFSFIFLIIITSLIFVSPLYSNQEENSSTENLTSNETGEIELTILNVQTYFTVGGNQTIIFNITGTADLIIIGVNGTGFADNLELKKGNKTQTDFYYIVEKGEEK